MTRPDDAVDGAELLNSMLSEADFQAQIVKLATTRGWRVKHEYDSRRGDPGWPDLRMLRPPRAIDVEVKTEKGRLSKDQREVLDLLAACGQVVYLWRPSDWDTIVEILE